MKARNRRLLFWILMFQEAQYMKITEIYFGFDVRMRFKGFLKTVESERIVSKLYASADNGLALVDLNNRNYKIELKEIEHLI